MINKEKEKISDYIKKCGYKYLDSEDVIWAYEKYYLRNNCTYSNTSGDELDCIVNCKQQLRNIVMSCFIRADDAYTFSLR